MSKQPVDECVRLKQIADARQKQIEDLSQMMADIVKKIEVEKTNIFTNEVHLKELDRAVNERDLELTEVRKEKEILFSKLQMAQKEVGRIKQAQGSHKGSFFSKVSTLFSFGPSQVDPKDNEFIQTSKGMVKKAQKEDLPTPERAGTTHPQASGPSDPGEPQLRDRLSSGSSNKSDEDEKTEDEILMSIRSRLEESS